MSQVEKYEVPGSPLTMAILKAALENMFAAIGDCNRGASAPSNPSEGMLWWDTSGTPTELLKRFTAVAGWVTLFSVNVTSGIVTPYRAGSPLGTMAAEAATDYIAKSLFNAQTILAAVDDNAPGPVSVAQNRIIGRRTGNIAALTLTDVLDMIGSAAEGDILYRGADGWVRLGKGSAGQGLRMNSYANAPEWGALDESALSLSDVTTGNVSTSKHGFVPKAPDDTGKFLRGDGTWAAAAPVDGTITTSKLVNYTVGSALIFGNENSYPLPKESSYVKVLAIAIPRSGALRIKFALHGYTDTVPPYTTSAAYACIYRNSSSVGTVRTAPDKNTVIFSEDISDWAPGDELQIWGKCARGGAVGNIQLYAAQLPCDPAIVVV